MQFHQQIVGAIRNGESDVVGLADSTAFPLERRLQIHQSTTSDSRISALYDSFPRCSTVFAQAFNKAVHDYCSKQPACSPNLEHYGDKLPATLQPPLFPAWASSLATLEWAVHLSCLATADTPAEVQPLSSLTTLTELTLSRVRLSLPQGCQLVSCKWAVADIWAEQSNRPPIEQASLYLVYFAENIRIHALTPSQATLVNSIQNGTSIQHLSAHRDLTHSIQQGWIIGWHEHSDA